MSIMDNSPPEEDSLTARFINLIKTQEWPEPEYRLLPRKENGSKEVYGCTVRGSYRFHNNEPLTYDYSTIPDEFEDKNDSKEAVSLKAFEDMSNKIKEAGNYIPITSDPDEIVYRVYQEVNTPNSKMVLRELEYPETETWDIYVTKVISSTEVWFRFVGPNYSDWLDSVLSEMAEHYEDWHAHVCDSPKVGELYFYPSDRGPARVKVLSLDTRVATVMYIDHGDIEQVSAEHLCYIDKKFCNLPPQAVSCRLYDLEEYSDNKMCTSFLYDKVEGMVLVAEIIQTEPLVLVMNDTSGDDAININQEIVGFLKIDVSSPPSLSQVEIFVRSSEGLVCVKQTLNMELDLSRKFSSLLLDDSRFDFTTINQVETPNIGMEWEVYVISVSNPTNFIVIPRTYLSDLKLLQERLQRFYNSSDISDLKNVENIYVGQVCAIKYGDSQWYRGMVDQIIDASKFQVIIKFCDYGNFLMTSSDKLFILEPSFMTLPALGISASLADIQPVSGDWDLEDCLLSQNLMLEKHLVTYIRSKDEVKSRQILKLQLFDTSQDNNHFDIGEFLVIQKRAKYI